MRQGHFQNVNLQLKAKHISRKEVWWRQWLQNEWLLELKRLLLLFANYLQILSIRHLNNLCFAISFRPFIRMLTSSPNLSLFSLTPRLMPQVKSRPTARLSQSLSCCFSIAFVSLITPRPFSFLTLVPVSTIVPISEDLKFSPPSGGV